MTLDKQELRTLRQLLVYTAERYCERPCIKYVENGEIEQRSFLRMKNDSLSFAGYLCSFIPARTHISVIGKTSYKYLCALNGVMAAGMTAVPLDPNADAQDTAALVKDSDSEVIVCAAELMPLAEEIEKINGRKYITVNYEKDPLAFSFEGSELPAEDAEKCAVIIYTSGTTGDKKGVMLSNRNIVSNILFKEMSYEGENVALNTLPMHHIFCFSCDYLKNMLDGVTLCLNGELSNIGENLLRFRPTVVRMVPMVIEGLLKKIRIVRKRNPDLTARQAAERVFGDRITNIIASGAYLNPSTGREFDEMGINLRQGYGMTETGPRIAVPNGKTDPDSAGAVISICDIRIQDGEIQVKSPSVMMGYYKKPEETAKVFTEDGWFKTGDMGRVAPDRQLYITGRLKNVIILSNGENVSPEEIEKRFTDIPLIKEVMVYGENDVITAEFYPDTEYAAANGITDIEKEIAVIVNKTNLSGSTDREVGKIKLRNSPFEKTSSGKIIRKAVKY
ncbi:MAG: AMP-binding protein [Clostridia bacterium]|nr:AMP-binding protein [Clostridia bacterium]